MKKTIEGKTYNTETATEIANWNNGLGQRDFGNTDETLYVTKKGAYFLAGEGGPMSRWSRACGNMTSGGDGIEVMTKAEALNWCERHELQGAIDIFFDDVIEEA